MGQRTGAVEMFEACPDGHSLDVPGHERVAEERG
jgi:hypothetical protein